MPNWHHREQYRAHYFSYEPIMTFHNCGTSTKPRGKRAETIYSQGSSPVSYQPFLLFEWLPTNAVTSQTSWNWRAHPVTMHFVILMTVSEGVLGIVSSTNYTSMDVCSSVVFAYQSDVLLIFWRADFQPLNLLFRSKTTACWTLWMYSLLTFQDILHAGEGLRKVRFTTKLDPLSDGWVRIRMEKGFGREGWL